MICPSCECDKEHIPDTTETDLSWCSFCGGCCTGAIRDDILITPPSKVAQRAA